MDSQEIAEVVRIAAPIAAAILAIAVAIRMIATAISTHSSTSARTVEQLRRWLNDAKRELATAREEITAQRKTIDHLTGIVTKCEREREHDRQQTAAIMARLEVTERRAKVAENRATMLARELEELRRDYAAGSGAERRTTLREPTGPHAVEVIRKEK